MEEAAEDGGSGVGSGGLSPCFVRAVRVELSGMGLGPPTQRKLLLLPNRALAAFQALFVYFTHIGAFWVILETLWRWRQRPVETYLRFHVRACAQGSLNLRQ